MAAHAPGVPAHLTAPPAHPSPPYGTPFQLQAHPVTALPQQTLPAYPPGFAPAAHGYPPVAPAAYAAAQPVPSPGSISPIVWDAPGNAATFAQKSRTGFRRGRGTQQRGPRQPGWVTRSFRSSDQLPRQRGSFARSFVVLLLLVGAGAFAARQLLSPEQQTALIGETRALWERGQVQAVGVIDRIRSRAGTVAPAIGLERPGAATR